MAATTSPRLQVHTEKDMLWFTTRVNTSTPTITPTTGARERREYVCSNGAVPGVEAAAMYRGGGATDQSMMTSPKWRALPAQGAPSWERGAQQGPAAATIEQSHHPPCLRDIAYGQQLGYSARATPSEQSRQPGVRSLPACPTPHYTTSAGSAQCNSRPQPAHCFRLGSGQRSTAHGMHACVHIEALVPRTAHWRGWADQKREAACGDGGDELPCAALLGELRRCLGAPALHRAPAGEPRPRSSSMQAPRDAAFLPAAAVTAAQRNLAPYSRRIR
jgi:hypothetical protein